MAVESNEVSTAPLSVENELAQLEKRQADLKSKLAEAHREKNAQTVDALAEAAKKRKEEEERDRLALEELARRKRERDEAEQKAQAERDLQAQRERQEREARLAKEKADREAREFEAQRLRNAREQEARLQAQLRTVQEDIARGISVAEQNTELPPSITDASHPMSRVFGTLDQTSKSLQEVDSVHKAIEEAAQKKTMQQASGLGGWNPRRKTQQFVDQGASAELERAIKVAFKMNANPQRCDQLSAKYDSYDLLKAVELVSQALAGKPTSHDTLFGAIDHLLETAGTANAA